ARAAWRRGDVRVPLAVARTAFSGRFAPRGSGAWLLDLATADGAPLEGDAPELRLMLVRDSAPVVAVPVPGRDTTLSLSLRQPLVIDARDDHGLTRLEVVSWRVSQTGKVGEPVRGSREATGARRGAEGEREGALPFQATERAQAVARDQEALQARVEELSRAVERIARAAQAAGIGDTAFQARLREVQELLRRAVTPELEQRLRELQEALAKLDPEATRRALERLAEAQQQLRAELERSQELFRRAAVEGTLASLAADAEDLRRRQAEWNRDAAPSADSAAAVPQRALASGADSLARGIGRVAKDIGARPGSALAAPEQAAREAGAAMQRAAQSANLRQAAAAGQAGADAERQLAGVPDQLRGQLDSLAQAWRGETLAALDRALFETAAMAAREQQVSDALHH